MTRQPARVAMDGMNHLTLDKVMIRAGLKRGILQYRCGLCAHSQSFQKLSDLNDHLSTHEVDVRGFFFAPAENERIFGRILLHAEASYPPRYEIIRHEELPTEKSMADRRGYHGRPEGHGHNPTLSCLAKDKVNKS